MSAILRHAARRLGGAMVQQAEAAVAEGRSRLVTRRLYSAEKGIAEGEKIVKDVSEKVSATPDGFSWRQIEFADISKGVGMLCNTVIIGGLALAVASECDVNWLLGRDKHPEVKKGAEKKNASYRMS